MMQLRGRRKKPSGMPRHSDDGADAPDKGAAGRATTGCTVQWRGVGSAAQDTSDLKCDGEAEYPLYRARMTMLMLASYLKAVLDAGGRPQESPCIGSTAETRDAWRLARGDGKLGLFARMRAFALRELGGPQWTLDDGAVVDTEESLLAELAVAAGNAVRNPRLLM